MCYIYNLHRPYFKQNWKNKNYIRKIYFVLWMNFNLFRHNIEHNQLEVHTLIKKKKLIKSKVNLKKKTQLIT